MKIKNFKKLAKTDLRKSALEIAEAGLTAIDTRRVIKENVRLQKGALFIKDRRFPLKSFKRLFVVGIGKCSLEAASELERIFAKRISGGIVVDVRPGQLTYIKTYTGTHPLPTQQNVDAAKTIVALLSSLNKTDLVLMVISGGGSTLLCQPSDFTCIEEASIIDCLLKVGANIREINTVRKHLSLARGGYLAKYAYPAKVVSLIFLDVLKNDLQFVASGPTVRDTTTIKQAQKVLLKYDVERRCGFSPRNLIETPKDKKYFKRVTNILLVNNRVALEAMKTRARKLGFKVYIRTSSLGGEARQAGKRIIRDLSKIGSKTVLLYGGETTVFVSGRGKGGRNQELVLLALRFIKAGQVILAIASDGRDNTEFAGAIGDIMTRSRAKKLNLPMEKYLQENDSFNFFRKTGDYLLTGHTGSNVSDLIVAIRE